MKNVRAENYWNTPGVGVHGDTSEQQMLYFATKLKEILNLSEADNLLDIGCGDGVISSLLIDDVGKISGFDFSSHNIEKAKDNLPESDYWVQSFMDAYAKQGYNKAFSFSVMQYCKPSLIHIFVDKSIEAVDEGGIIYHLDVPDSKKMFAEYLRKYKGIYKPVAYLKYIMQLLNSGLISSNDGSYAHDLDKLADLYKAKGYDAKVVESWCDYRSHLIIKKE